MQELQAKMTDTVRKNLDMCKFRTFSVDIDECEYTDGYMRLTLTAMKRDRTMLIGTVSFPTGANEEEHHLLRIALTDVVESLNTEHSDEPLHLIVLAHEEEFSIPTGSDYSDEIDYDNGPDYMSVLSDHHDFDPSTIDLTPEQEHSLYPDQTGELVYDIPLIW